MHCYVMVMKKEEQEPLINGDGNYRVQYEVRAREDEWVLVKKGGDKAIFKEDTKEKLLEKSKPYENDHDGILDIYQADGDLENRLYDYCLKSASFRNREALL